jgi:hypothetical protein
MAWRKAKENSTKSEPKDESVGAEGSR